MSGNAEKRPEAAGAKALIEDSLRKVYQETLDEEIPDKLKDLLAQLRGAVGRSEVPK